MYVVAEALGVPNAHLGEGPVWHADALWFVDIESHRLHRYAPRSGELTTYDAGQRIGVAVPTTRGDWLLGLESGLAFWRPEAGGLPQLFLRPDSQGEGVRFNDGKVGPDGRFYVGTMGLSAEPGRGQLYRLDIDGRCHVLLDEVTISNGLAWHPVEPVFYYIDTATGCVDRFDWDPAEGTITNRRSVYTFAQADGAPDGMSIDSMGRLWIALWGGGCVACVDPQVGRELKRVQVNARCVTSCCFGGLDLCDLYITSSAMGDATDGGAAHTQAGDLFRVRLEHPGLAPRLFQKDFAA